MLDLADKTLFGLNDNMTIQMLIAYCLSVIYTKLSPFTPLPVRANVIKTKDKFSLVIQSYF